MNCRRWAVALAVAGSSAAVAKAQDVRIADSLLRRGLVDRAETEYYAAARARPRDPDARFALGRYLLDRGAFRIGATLIDESMQFGYDRAVRGLNAYRGVMAARCRYAEVFQYLSVESTGVAP